MSRFGLNVIRWEYAHYGGNATKTGEAFRSLPSRTSNLEWLSGLPVNLSKSKLC